MALSGGPDSVAVTLVLINAGIKIKALHCNFHLRGEESDRDMRFVESFCKNYEVPLEIKEYDVKKFLDTNKGMSLEMACRKLRYEWFDRKLEETGYDRIATGHNADDNIETFFLNLFRGSGTRGLRGMRNDTGKIWRPLLSFHRSDILKYLHYRKQNFIIDSTNLESDYRRNFLRNKIIPLLKEEWKGFNTALDKTIKNIEAENSLLETLLKDTLPSEGSVLSVNIILSSPAPLLIIKRFIDPYGPYSATPQEILSAIKANKPHIRKWKLKWGTVFLRNGSLFVEMIHGECCT